MTAYYTGEVWPGKVYYIDYLHPNASVFWDLQMKRLNKKIDFSGIWLDMNEPTNFKGGLKSSEESLKIQQS
jgi:alpha-glucosidase (family GH31 glycosyl hydrolase)